jgi:hypothetical protein
MMGIVRVLRIASLIICAIVIASFAMFALDQTSTASGEQQQQVAAAGGVTASQPAGASQSGSTSSHESSLRKAIDEVASKLTSPFSGIVSGAESEWVVRGVETLLALLVYGFGLGFIARTLRVRV